MTKGKIIAAGIGFVIGTIITTAANIKNNKDVVDACDADIESIKKDSNKKITDSYNQGIINGRKEAATEILNTFNDDRLKNSSLSPEFKFRGMKKAKSKSELN